MVGKASSISHGLKVLHCEMDANDNDHDFLPDVNFNGDPNIVTKSLEDLTCDMMYLVQSPGHSGPPFHLHSPLCLTLAIIFKLLLSPNIHPSQGDSQHLHYQHDGIVALLSLSLHDNYISFLPWKLQDALSHKCWVPLDLDDACQNHLLSIG